MIIYKKKYVTLQFVQSMRYTISVIKCNTESYRRIREL